jgi:transposase
MEYFCKPQSVMLCGLLRFADQLSAQEVLNIDESPTKEGPAKAWIWTIVAMTFTFFACRTSRAADVFQELIGEAYDGIIHCDRARMYWRFDRLQWCSGRLQSRLKLVEGRRKLLLEDV